MIRPETEPNAVKDTIDGTSVHRRMTFKNKTSNNRVGYRNK